MEFHKIFNSSNARQLLKNKFIVVIGDSNQRAVYKDLVLLIKEDRYLSQGELRSKGEWSFLEDELVEGGRKEELTNGVDYKEIRQFQTDEFLVRFYFVTRCYNCYVETIMSDLIQGPSVDLVIMNSCLWDISRYGKKSVAEYKNNLVDLFKRFKEVLPKKSLVIWSTTLPIANNARGGFLVPSIEFLTSSLRLDILEANYYATTVASGFGFDVLDLHFYLRHYLSCRAHDGVHWDRMAHRYISNLILSHVCEAWGVPHPLSRPPIFGSYGSRAALARVEDLAYNRGWENQQEHYPRNGPVHRPRTRNRMNPYARQRF